MTMVEQITRLITYITIGLIVVFILVGIALIVRYKNKNKRRGVDEVDDNALLVREDSANYIKIDDIEDDMVITEDGTRFIAAVKCQGFDFFNAPEAKQGATAAQFFAFIGTIDGRVTYRQHSMAVDLEDTLKQYEKAHKEVESELYNVVEDQKELASTMRKNIHMLNEEEVNLYEEKNAALNRDIDALSFRLAHLKDQIRYIHKYSGNGVMPEIVQMWIFEWCYNNLDFSIDLSKEEIYKKAKSELKSKAKSIIYALENSGVKAVRCTKKELIEVNRRYSAPISADRYKQRDVDNSSYFDDINTSDSVKDLEKRAKKASSEYMEDGMVNLILNSTSQSEQGGA